MDEMAPRGHPRMVKPSVRRREMSLNYCYRDQPNIHRLLVFALVPGPHVPCPLSLLSLSLVYCFPPQQSSPSQCHQLFCC